MNAAIAQHLNVAESAIVRVEEWASVMFAVIKGIGARFVSKKITEVKPMDMIVEAQCSDGDWVKADLSRYSQQILDREDVIAPRYNRQPMTNQAEIASYLLAGNEINWGSDWYATIRAPKAKKELIFTEAPKMQTSTGEWVTPDEWDEIEGAM